MADFKKGDKVKIIGGSDKQYIGKIGVISQYASPSSMPSGFRKPNEGIKGRKEIPHRWVIMLKGTNKILTLFESDIEKIS